MASSLPPEIWFTIVDYLPRRDQLRVSRVSPQLCTVARKIVYRNVELRSNHFAVGATLALLNRDYSLARNIKRLRIYTATYTRQEPTWFDTDVLAGMTNLCGLELTGMPFHTEEDQLTFTNTVSESLHMLRKLEYYALEGKTHTSDPETCAPALQISKLQEITWIDPDTFVYPSPILTPINASRETLTHIRIPEATSNATTHDLTKFFFLRFPYLSMLHLGGWNIVNPVGTALTNFLIAHPLIEELNLCFLNSNPDSKVHCHVSSDVALDPGSLPNLRHLTVDAFNLRIFLRSGVSSLQALEILHTGVGYFDERNAGFVEFEEMYTALEAYGGLPGLKVLELELEGVDGSENARWIAGFGKLCPRVERFWGDYEVRWIAATNQDIFASYCNLKSQVMPGAGFDALSNQDRMNHVKDFAARNPSVMELLFYSPDDDEIMTFHFRIVRDTKGEIAAIVEVLENGDG